MTRNEMINVVGNQFHTANIEGGEFSYVKEAGSIERLHQCLGYDFQHYKLDIRFKSDDVVVLIETKQSFVKADELASIRMVCSTSLLMATCLTPKPTLISSDNISMATSAATISTSAVLSAIEYGSVLPSVCMMFITTVIPSMQRI